VTTISSRAVWGSVATGTVDGKGAAMAAALAASVIKNGIRDSCRGASQVTVFIASQYRKQERLAISDFAHRRRGAIRGSPP
jgi:hypothetical protein